MTDIVWRLRRLKAMSVPEIVWRVSQKGIQKNEKSLFASQKIPVNETIFNDNLAELGIDANKMQINLDNKAFGLHRTIPLLGGYDYEKYRMEWNAGFQTEAVWPDSFSYALRYKQRDDIGDARTNWELNRHYQFAILAKDYFASGDSRYLDEFMDLFEDWNQRNPFLHGISWTSAMEVAIRVSNWCYAYCFLSRARQAEEGLLEQLRIGIINMTEYIACHYSRYSSANNHLIVEAYAIGQSGILLNYQPWVDLSIQLITQEFPVQNYEDGVNKELSLHYQSFYMEAVGLMMRLLIKNKYMVPRSWPLWLEKMGRYLADCMGSYGEVVEFGDNDEGKVLDLCGRGVDHYRYVLGLLSCLLQENYISLENCEESLCWLFTDEERKAADGKKAYRAKGSVCYREGGNSILRSDDGRVLIGVDHAALGFGSIAAHGHADALSFQIYMDGIPVFIDPGTYIYHSDLDSRNAFRKTENHNTVCVDNRDQSEMLGAFLWGKKAECKLLEYNNDGKEITLKAAHDGYRPVIHIRTFTFDKNRILTIKDELSVARERKTVFVLAPDEKAEISEDKSDVHVEGKRYRIIFKCDSKHIINIENGKASTRYGVSQATSRIVFTTYGKMVTSKIVLRD